MWQFRSKILIICSLLSTPFAEIAEQPMLTSNSHVGLTECYSAQTLGSLKLTISFFGSMAYDEDLVTGLVKQASAKRSTTMPFAVMYDFAPSVALGINEFIDLSFSQPFGFDLIEGVLPSGGIGDLRGTVKCGLRWKRKQIVDAALVTAFTIPYNNAKQGYFMRHSYFSPDVVDNEIPIPNAFISSSQPSLTLIAVSTLKKWQIQLHINVGAIMLFGGQKEDEAAIGAAGFEYRISEWAGFFTEIYSEPRLYSLFTNHTLSNDPFHSTSGFHFSAPGGAHFTLCGTFRLTSGNVRRYYDPSGKMLLAVRTEPAWKLSAQLSWGGSVNRLDRDHDQIPDKVDACPDVAEDTDGFADTDGCPDIDNDQDHIPDDRDTCSTIAEDIDGYFDNDGCPDFDNDNDALADSADSCKNEAEDKDGIMDNDGCPDFDNDLDGIPDTVDKCILVPEDHDGFEDGDGCADSDNDGDGIPDSLDKCPDTVGTRDQNGCPKVREKGKEIRYGRLILPGVHFDAVTATLTSGALVELDRLYYSLVDWPTTKIEVQAHTDNTQDFDKSMELSQKRASSVVDFLMEKGIVNSRLRAIGKGNTTPIADNKTIQGRQLNNRIEIFRID